MTDLLLRIQHTSFCMWVHNSPSVLAYPTILFLHVVGMGLVVSISAGIDLRILGFAPALPLAPMGKFLRLVWIGLCINAVTGTIIAAADAVNKFTNPDFYIKLLLVALGVITLRQIEIRVLRDPLVDNGPLPAKAKVLAFASLIFWLGAMLAGRLLAYVGPGSGT